MLVLGHAGITLGSAVLLSGAITAIRSQKATRENKTTASSHSPQPPAAPDNPRNRPALWLTSLARHIDIRLLLIGSLLTDIIDKPLGLIFSEVLSNTRTISHTLLFTAIISFAGLIIYRRSQKNWLLVVSLGAMVHLILDQMWQTPETLFWPLFGFAFVNRDISSYVSDIFESLTTKPEVYIPEIFGGLILIWFAWEVLRRRKLISFIRYGRL